jgi:hypothetical protein
LHVKISNLSIIAKLAKYSRTVARRRNCFAAQDSDPNNAKVITGIRLDEISLVDRPQNPDAVIDVVKAAVTKLPSATGRSIEEMWADLHEASMLIDGMDDSDPRKHEARAEHQRAVEKTLAHQFKPAMRHASS